MVILSVVMTLSGTVSNRSVMFDEHCTLICLSYLTITFAERKFGHLVKS
jgi:hypothetical protein